MRVELAPHQLQTSNIKNTPQFNVGQNISAKVAVTGPDGVYLQTSDGQLLRAENTSNAPLTQGDVVTMQVTGTDISGKTSLQLLSINGNSIAAEFTQAQVTLLNAGVNNISADAHTMGQALLNSGAPLNPTTMAALSNILTNYPGLNLDIAAFAVANSIPINAQPAPLFFAFADGQLPMGDLATQLQSYVEQIQLPKSEFAQALSSSYPNISGIAEQSPSFEAFSSRLMSLPPNSVPGAIAEFVSTLPVNPQAQNAIAITLQTVYSQVQQDSQTPTLQPDAQNSSGTQNIAQNSENVATTPAPTAEQAIQNSANSATTAPTQSFAPLSAQNVSDMLTAIGRLFAGIDPGNANAPEITATLSNQQNNLENIRQLATQHFSQNPEVIAQAEQLAARTEMPTNNQNFYYFQLPFEYKEQKSTAELFVFKRNNRGADDESSTVVVALDTENMGRVETILRTSGTSLGINMNVENSHIREYLTAHSAELADSIAGYKVTGISVDILKTRITPATANKLMGHPANLSAKRLDIQI